MRLLVYSGGNVPPHRFLLDLDNISSWILFSGRVVAVVASNPNWKLDSLSVESSQSESLAARIFASSFSECDDRDAAILRWI